MSFHPTTQRLVMRAPMVTDMPDFIALLGDYDVAKNLRQVPQPYTAAHFDSFLRKSEAKRRAREGFAWAVTRAMDGALLGLCAIDRNEDGIWEFGYWYGKAYWNQGYATEAARPVLRFAFEDMTVERLTAGWFDDNPASGAVLSKLGFSATCSMRVHAVGRGCEVLSNRVQLTRDEFTRKKAL